MNDTFCEEIKEHEPSRFSRYGLMWCATCDEWFDPFLYDPTTAGRGGYPVAPTYPCLPVRLFTELKRSLELGDELLDNLRAKARPIDLPGINSVILIRDYFGGRLAELQSAIGEQSEWSKR